MKNLDHFFQLFLSERTKRNIEKAILTIAIVSFLVHLSLIVLVDTGLLPVRSQLLDNPIAAIYTPFSFILIYEVYLLIYYLPQSITTYIGKQYEIITLIIIRRLFKDLGNLKLTSNWFELQNDLQFTYDLVASVILFFLIYLFYLQSLQRRKLLKAGGGDQQVNIRRFIKLKKAIATLLVPVLFGTAVYFFLSWGLAATGILDAGSISFKNINNVFFDEFFTILIVVDVILLLASFYYSDRFHKVIRNSGFVISTILIRISFSVEGLINTALIITAILFGWLMLLIHNKFEQKIREQAT